MTRTIRHAAELCSAMASNAVGFVQTAELFEFESRKLAQRTFLDVAWERTSMYGISAFIWALAECRLRERLRKPSRRSER